ncbi:MAG TPA: hypothetical protein VN794_01070, partial [Methylomirabilota bacterium]|nr:hypothetical protein [Methylomirabilota bacterium]
SIIEAPEFEVESCATPAGLPRSVEALASVVSGFHFSVTNLSVSAFRSNFEFLSDFAGSDFGFLWRLELGDVQSLKLGFWDLEATLTAACQSPRTSGKRSATCRINRAFT